MKTNKFLAIVAFVLPLLFVSCSSDDEETASSKSEPILQGDPLPEGEIFRVDGISYLVTSSEKRTVEVTQGTLGEYSYYGDVVIPERVNYEDCTYLVTSIGYAAFSYCNFLTSVVIPNTVVTIDEYAFYDCIYLDSVNIPEGLTEISKGVFEGCISLEKMSIPNSVNSIGESAFSNCSGLQEITIGNSVTSIESSAFTNCTGLKEVTIPTSVSNIAETAFYHCDNLSVINVSDENKYYCSKDGILYSKDMTSLIHFPAGSSITSYAIPSTVTAIGDYLFMDCINIIEIIIPNSVTSIGNDAFHCCTGLTSITIPNSVTSIGASAFWSCSNLVDLTIGSSVEKIGTESFAYCNKIATITSLNSSPPDCRNDHVFFFVSKSSCTVFVPLGAKDAYSTAFVWQDFTNIVEIE